VFGVKYRARNENWDNTFGRMNGIDVKISEKALFGERLRKSALPGTFVELCRRNGKNLQKQKTVLRRK